METYGRRRSKASWVDAVMFDYVVGEEDGRMTRDDDEQYDAYCGDSQCTET